MILRALAAMTALILASTAASAATLDTVRKRGNLTCGVSQDAPGLAVSTPSGEWSGMEVDFCRSLAAAIFGDARLVRFRPLASPERFEALRSGEIDILARSERWTMSSDVENGITFAAILFHSGLAIMVPKRLDVTSVRELSGSRLCVTTGSDSMSLQQYATTRDMPIIKFEARSWHELTKAYAAQKCAGLVGDAVLLAADRHRRGHRMLDVLLPERLSLQPVGVMVRSNDTQWLKIVRWSMNALLAGESLGAGASGVAAALPAAAADLKVLLGFEGESGTALGLSRDWANDMLAQVGNYGEIFARNLGEGSPLALPRDRNALWSHGGLRITYPFR